jgi:two-component system, LytTR family, response regulator
MIAMVIDDEILSAEHICRLLEKMDITVLCYTNPYDALGKIDIHKPDVLFLDIEMPEISGLELAEEVQNRKIDCEIVFITGHNQYAIEAFNVNALDYLLKPIIGKQIDRAIQRVKKRREIYLINKADINNSVPNERKIKISLFGKVSVYDEYKKKQIRFMTAKSAEIFCFLLLHKNEKDISKWRLMDAIWPDKDLDKGDINLRSSISRLNKTFRENLINISIKSTGNGYQLDLQESELEIDAYLLEILAYKDSTIQTGDVALWEQIILSYNDMLLEDFDSEWCENYRNIYHRYFMSTAQKLVNYFESIPMKPFRTLCILEKMLKFEPYDEKIRERALELYYEMGGKSGVDKYYKDYVKMIKKDLGIEPGEQLKRKYKEFK